MPSDPALVTGRLNVSDYVNARTSDIKKLEDLIGGAGANSKKRAFQSLPRVQRRRAASHDPKRVPRKKGLRKKAEFENLRDNAKKRKVRRNTNNLGTTSQDSGPVDVSSTGTKCDPSQLLHTNLKYSSRQKDKVWLPTHIWHRKRAFLTNISGIMVPQTATQKQYRRTYRLSSHIDEHGAMAWDSSYNSTIIAHHKDMKTFLGNMFPGSTLPIYSQGLKIWQGMLKNKGPVLLHCLTDETVAIQCHPLIFNDLWDSLQTFGGSTMVLEDCRFAIGSIDLFGPQAAKILKEILVPILYTSVSAQNSWQSFEHTNFFPSRGSVSLYVLDPRIFNFRSSLKDSKDSVVAADDADGLLGVYSKIKRTECLQTQLPQCEVDQRRKDKAFEVSNSDSKIPITIMVQDDGRLRILMPRNWVLPFWLAMFKGRQLLIGGQQELDQVAFESGLPSFPKDFPQTPAGAIYNDEAAVNRQEKYQRKPKSKRVNYKNELGCPFKTADLDLFPGCSTETYVHVRVKALERGVPYEGARIYYSSLDDATIKSGRSSDVQCLNVDNLAGFVTSGNFSLSASKGAGIGLVKEKPKSNVCVIKNIGSTVGFIATIEIVPSAGKLH